MKFATRKVSSIPLELPRIADQELVEVNMQIIQKDDEISDLKENLLALSSTMEAMQRSNERQQFEVTSLVV